MDEREKRLAEKIGYRIDGERKYLVSPDGREIGPEYATDCEMKSWAECLRLMAEQEQLFEASVEIYHAMVEEFGEDCMKHPKDRCDRAMLKLRSELRKLGREGLPTEGGKE